MNSNNSQDDDRVGKLFLKVLKNKVIWNIIREQLYKYKVNKKIRFYNIKDMLEYREREYITELELHFEKLPFAHEIPSCIKILSLDNNPKLKKSNIPITISHLKIGSTFYKQLEKDTIPDNIEYLEFKNGFSSPIEKDAIPDSVTKLKYGQNFKFPNSINGIPKSVKTLILCDQVNCEIAYQSNYILYCLLHYNELLIPNNIETLILGENYNTIIKPNSLPPTLTHLQFGRCYDRPLDKCSLPVGLKSIVFGEEFSQVISDNILPTSLTSLHFKNPTYNMNGIKLPQEIKELKIGNKTINNNTLQSIINNNNNNNNKNNNSIHKNISKFINKILDNKVI